MDFIRVHLSFVVEWHILPKLRFMNETSMFKTLVEDVKLTRGISSDDNSPQ